MLPMGTGHRGSKSRPGAHRAGALRSAWRVTGEGDQTHVPGPSMCHEQVYGFV